MCCVKALDRRLQQEHVVLITSRCRESAGASIFLIWQFRTSAGGRWAGNLHNAARLRVPSCSADQSRQRCRHHHIRCHVSAGLQAHLTAETTAVKVRSTAVVRIHLSCICCAALNFAHTRQANRKLAKRKQNKFRCNHVYIVCLLSLQGMTILGRAASRHRRSVPCAKLAGSHSRNGVQYASGHTFAGADDAINCMATRWPFKAA